MDLETCVAKMLAQVASLRESAMMREFAWTVEVADPTVYVGLTRLAEPGKVYLLRIQFGDFDRRAPLYTFVDPVTKVRAAACCPPNVEHSEGKICTPGTREFHEDLHKNDAQYLWDSEKYPVLNTVRMIHRMINR